MAASDSLRTRAPSRVSAASMTSPRIGATDVGWWRFARLSMASRSRLRVALLTSVYLAMPPTVSFSTLSLSLDQGSMAMMRDTGR